MNSLNGYNPKVQEIVLSRTLLAWCHTSLQHLLAREREITRIEPLRVEASHRQFYRVHLLTDSYVLMVSPPALEHNDAFITLAKVFADAQIPVPKVIKSELAQGWFLLTDLGSEHLEQVYVGQDRDRAITAALQLLVRLAQIEHPAIERYSSQRMNDELGIFNEWFLHGLLGITPTTNLVQPYAALVNATKVQPQGCVHRDFHCRNLLWRQQHLGVVDFQDALHGPILYDPASLLRDCYFEFSDSAVHQWLTYYASIQPKLFDVEFDTALQWLNFTAIQRQLKAVGIFARLHLRDQKSSHLTHIMPVLRHLHRLTEQYPELTNIHMQLSDCITTAEPVLAQIAVKFE